MRTWRPAYSDLTEIQRKKSISRAYANVYQGKGRLKKQPCQLCGSEVKVEKHHEDYSNPLDVIWLCRKCHISHHMRFDEKVGT